MTRVLVTGASGCVGRALVDEALAAGWAVRGLSRRLPSPPLPAAGEVLRGDVQDAAVVARAVAGCAAVVHLASWTHAVPRTCEEHAALAGAIVGGTRVVAEAAQSAGARLVTASTVAVYGSRFSAAVTEATPPAPDTPYGRAKLAAEEVAVAACPDATVLRIALVHGAFDRGNVTRLARLVDRGLGVVLAGGHNRKSLVFAPNLARRILGVLALPAARVRGIWIAADDPAPTQRELLECLARALGKRAPISVPAGPVRLAAGVLDGLTRGARWRDRVDKLLAPTEFVGRPLDEAIGFSGGVPLDEAVGRTVSWWREARS